VRFRIEEGVNEAQIDCEGVQIGCEVAVFVVLNVFFFVEEAFVGAFHLVMTTVTARSNWWVVGVKRNFGRFYTLFVMNFRENDFWSQPSKNRCKICGWFFAIVSHVFK